MAGFSIPYMCRDESFGKNVEMGEVSVFPMYVGMNRYYRFRILVLISVFPICVGMNRFAQQCYAVQ